MEDGAFSFIPIMANRINRFRTKLKTIKKKVIKMIYLVANICVTYFEVTHNMKVKMT